MNLDELDRQILRELQRDSRISNQELADRISLSPSPCLRRVRRLEAAGVILRHAAIVDPAQVGLAISAYVRITLERHGEEVLAAVEERIASLPEIVDAALLAGDQDYLLRVVSPSFEAYETFLRTQLRTMPAVASVQTTFAYRALKTLSPLPI